MSALHGRDSQDNANSHRNSDISSSDSLPPYRLHDDGHILPKINGVYDDTSSRCPQSDNSRGSYSMVSVFMFMLTVSLWLLDKLLTIHAKYNVSFFSL